MPAYGTFVSYVGLVLDVSSIGGCMSPLDSLRLGRSGASSSVVSPSLSNSAVSELLERLCIDTPGDRVTALHVFVCEVVGLRLGTSVSSAMLYDLRSTRNIHHSAHS